VCVAYIQFQYESEMPRYTNVKSKYCDGNGMIDNHDNSIIDISVIELPGFVERKFSSTRALDC
jgi:hypothetical protein